MATVVFEDYSRLGTHRSAHWLWPQIPASQERGFWSPTIRLEEIGNPWLLKGSQCPSGIWPPKTTHEPVDCPALTPLIQRIQKKSSTQNSERIEVGGTGEELEEREWALDIIKNTLYACMKLSNKKNNINSRRKTSHPGPMSSPAVCAWLECCWPID